MTSSEERKCNAYKYKEHIHIIIVPVEKLFIMLLCHAFICWPETGGCVLSGTWKDVRITQGLQKVLENGF